MKSNLAVLSSDNKTIKFIKNNNLEDLCNLYANSSRNTDDAKLLCIRREDGAIRWITKLPYLVKEIIKSNTQKNCY